MSVSAHDPRWYKSDLSLTLGGVVTASRADIAAGNAYEFMGWSIRETTGSATAAFRLRDGDVNGEVIANANLAANESIRDLFAPNGVRVNTGRIYLQVLSGSIEGVVYWR